MNLIFFCSFKINENRNKMNRPFVTLISRITFFLSCCLLLLSIIASNFHECYCLPTRMSITPLFLLPLFFSRIFSLEQKTKFSLLVSLFQFFQNSIPLQKKKKLDRQSNRCCTEKKRKETKWERIKCFLKTILSI